MSGYRDLFRLPGAPAAVASALAARLALTMIALALLLAAVDTGYSYAAAGGASAVYAGGYALAAPLHGRLMDRRGTSVVVGLAGLAAPVALVAATLAIGRVAAPLLVGLALVAGVLTPPVGASMRALWSSLTTDRDLLGRAYAFEATLSEALFVVGPAGLTVLAVTAGVRAALLTCAILLGVGCLGYALAPATRRRGPAPVAPPSTRPTGVLVAVLGGVAGTAAMCGALNVALVVALRAQHGPASLAGALIALQAAASIAGGLVYGARPAGASYPRYVRLLVILTVTMCPLPVAVLAYRAGLPAGAALALLCGLLVLSGVAIAPAGAAEFQLVADITAAQRMTQAFAGVGGVIAFGEAAGAAIAGYVADHAGAAVTLLLPAACAAAALGIMVAARRPVSAATMSVQPG